MPSPSEMTQGHMGLLMLSLVVVAIMLGFPTAFTLMGMGVIFSYFAYHSQGASAQEAITKTLDLMVQRTYGVMANDVLISIPLFVFMGYLVERANLIEKLFKSLHLAMARVPGSLAVATLVTCAIFATATGIVGAVVTLMGLLAMPAMLRSGYSVSLASGAITAGGCLGILIPPSVLLILYGATAGESVVKLYAGAHARSSPVVAALLVPAAVAVSTEAGARSSRANSTDETNQPRQSGAGRLSFIVFPVRAGQPAGEAPFPGPGHQAPDSGA